MTKEFTIPPVIFPSGEASTTINVPGGSNLHRRRWPPTTPFQPPLPTTNYSPIPFTSFDLGPTSIFAPLHGTASAFSDEPSLLEELEIDADLIYRKTLSLLNPFRLNPSIHDSADLSGPFLYYMTFCLFQMFAGKVQFGVVLGCIVVFSTFLYIIFNMLEGKNGNLDLYRCFSLVGYSMLPEVVFSAVSLLIPRGGACNFGLAAVVIVWSTGICARLLAEGGSGDNTHRGLIAYPCLLIYAVFSMLVMF